MKVKDLTREEISLLAPIEAPGLWFDYNGEKRTPCRVYFSSDLREWWENPAEYEGRLYTLFDNVLRPVYGQDGKQFERRGVACVNAWYKEGVIQDFHRE